MKLNIHPFSMWWWQYLFEKPLFGKKLTLKMLICRIKGHPNGSWYYNAYGDEPDGRCKDCGEWIE